MKLCKVCESELYRQNKTGYCRKCWNTSDEKRAKISATMREHWRNPELRAMYSEAGARNLSTPGAREKAVEIVKQRRTWEIASSHITPEARKRGTIRAMNTRLADVPREYRDEYRRLRRSHRMSREEAIEMIRQQQETDMERFRRKLGART